jgi:hypothetical protein
MIARRMYASDLKNPGSALRAGVFCGHLVMRSAARQTSLA